MFRMQIGIEFHAARPAVVDMSLYVEQRNHHVSMIGDGDY